MQLFNTKTIKRHIARAAAPDPARLETLRQWGETIRDRSIETQKETALHGNFKQRIICEVLGYQDFNDSGQWTVDVEAQIGAGSVDLALGQFSKGERRIIAPFELKGAKTRNLDAIMPGRAKTPVQQAWEYASDNVGTKWVLVSNYLEIRLYSYAEGRQFHERFDLATLHDPAEYQRFMLLLSADNLLSGGTLALLEESRKEDRDITARLYSDYRTLRSNLIGAVQAALPDGEPLESIRLGQTILDRVLFIAFAEDIGWFVWGGFAAIARGGVRRLFAQHIEKTPILLASDSEKGELGKLAETAQVAAEKRHDLQQAITRRIPDLAADPANARLTGKLKEWWTLPDFAAFHKEVEKALKAKIPLLERNEWESWITTSRAEIHALTAEIARLEADINARVYALFGLTPAEIALLEANV